MQGLCAQLPGGLSPFSLYIYKQCSSRQGLCAWLMGGSISLLYIYISSVAVCKGSVLNWWGSISFLYIYKQCSSMQGLCAQLTGEVYLPSLSIYISSVAVCKAILCLIDWGVYLPSLSLYISSVAVCKASVLDWLGSLSTFSLYISSVVVCKAICAWLMGVYLPSIYIYKQCSSMQELCAQLTGGLCPFSLSLSLSLSLYIYIYIYIYISIYISSVVVCKASVLDWLGGLSPFYIYLYKQCSSMQGLCAWLTGESISLLYIYI